MITSGFSTSLVQKQDVDDGDFSSAFYVCLVSAVVYSISLILQKPLVAKLPAIQVTWLACTIGAIACLVVTLMPPGPRPAPVTTAQEAS